VGVLQCTAQSAGEELKKWIESQYACTEIWIQEAPAVAIIHISPNSLGLVLYNE